MLMNSRGGPPILRGGPPLGTISMDQTVFSCMIFCLDHLDLQNANKDFRIFVTSVPKVTKSDQKPKMG